MQRSSFTDYRLSNEKSASETVITNTLNELANNNLAQIAGNLSKTQAKDNKLQSTMIPLCSQLTDNNDARVHTLKLNIKVMQNTLFPLNHWQPQNDSDKTFNVMLSRQNANINLKDTFCDKEANNKLFSAVREQNISLIKEAINQEAEINIQNVYGSTVLHHASASGNIEIVQLLLANKANPEIKDNNYLTPLALAQQNYHNQVTSLLSFPSNMSYSNLTAAAIITLDDPGYSGELEPLFPEIKPWLQPE